MRTILVALTSAILGCGCATTEEHSVAIVSGSNSAVVTRKQVGQMVTIETTSVDFSPRKATYLRLMDSGACVLKVEIGHHLFPEHWLIDSDCKAFRSAESHFKGEAKTGIDPR